MVVEVWLKDCSLPRVYKTALNVFQEAALVCVDTEDCILKYPLSNVFRIVEHKPNRSEVIAQCEPLFGGDA